LNKRAHEGADLGLLSDMAPELAETFVSVASEIALVVDLEGTVNSVAIGGETVSGLAGDWVGRRFVDIVTPECRGKVEQLLRDVNLVGVARRRQVNHPSPAGGDVPVSYAMIRLGLRGPLLAVGRDMRPVAAIQQRFVQSQLQLERDASRRRRAETRYRTLFQAVPDAMLVVDADTLRIVESNGTGPTLLDEPLETLPGRALLELFDAQDRAAAMESLARAVGAATPVEIRTHLARTGMAIDLAVSTIEAGAGRQLLVRIRPAGRAQPMLAALDLPLGVA
jgi:transcriptional regulator PpsR